jgi:GxxExxY protein
LPLANSRKMKIEKLSSRIIGCALKVHKHLGYGYQELIYQRALEFEFQEARINHKREQEMDI